VAHTSDGLDHRWNLTHFGQIFELPSSALAVMLCSPAFPSPLLPPEGLEGLWQPFYAFINWRCQIVSSAWFASQLVLRRGSGVQPAWVAFSCSGNVDLCARAAPIIQCPRPNGRPSCPFDSIQIDSIWYGICIWIRIPRQDLWLLNGLA